MNRFKYRLNFEKDILENLFDTEIFVFSFHNPEIGGWTSFGDDEVDRLMRAVP